MKRLLLALCAVVSALAQQNVTITQKPGTPPYVFQYYYDANGNVIYTCRAAQLTLVPSSVKRADSTLTSIAVSTNVGTVTTAAAHNLWIGALVVVSGSTTAALNGTYKVLTVPTSTTYTITTSGVADATYNSAATVITTNQPLLSDPVWAIQVNTYNTSLQLTGSYWAGANSGEGIACSTRANY
jgi:hypothetical protein